MSTFQLIPIGSIHESKLNPRRTFDEGHLAELAASIKEKGILQPVLVRPNAKGFELVAGARRYRAAVIAELSEIPAMVRELDDKQCLEVMVIENAQRADVHPLEEADAFQTLIKTHGHDVDSIAARIGKPTPYVRSRLSLCSLEKNPREALRQGFLPLGHAQIIARLDPKDQSAALEACGIEAKGKSFEITSWQGVVTLRHLRDWITRSLTLHMQHAKWSLDDASLLPVAGACSTCVKRTGVNAILFPELESDVCTDRECWNAKVVALRKIGIDKAIAQGVQLLSCDYNAKKANLPKEVLQDREWAEVGNWDTDAVKAQGKPGYIIDGYREGKTVQWVSSKLSANTDDKREEKRKEEELFQRTFRPAVLSAIAASKVISTDPVAALKVIARAHWKKNLYSSSYQLAAAKALGLDVPKRETGNGKSSPNPGAVLDSAESFCPITAFAVLTVASEVVNGYGEAKALLELAQDLDVDVAAIKKCVKADLAAKAEKKAKKSGGQA